MTVLLVTEKTDLAADLVVLALKRAATPFFRLNAETLVEDGSGWWSSADDAGRIEVGETSLDLDDVHSVWFRRFAAPSDSYPLREAAAFIQGWSYLLSDVFWMNHPLVLGRAENKMFQLRTAARCGLAIPPTVVGNNFEVGRARIEGPDVVAKTLGGARVVDSGEDFHLFSQRIQWESIDEPSVRAAPLILQRPVKPGTDIRATFVGEECFAAEIEVIDDTHVDWRSVTDEKLNYRQVELPQSVLRGCLAMNRVLGLEYAAYDFVAHHDGSYWFLEVNPSGQWGWIEQALGFPLSDRIAARLSLADSERSLKVTLAGLGEVP